MNQVGCKVHISRSFNSPPERVFDAWLDPEKAAKFLFATETGIMKKVEIDARVGGRFYIVETRDGVDAEHLGEYQEIDRPRRLQFSFDAPPPFPVTTVTITITATEPGCHLELSHQGVPRDYESSVIEGWTGILDYLQERGLT